MLIVIEGTDNVGKSWFTNQLAKRLGDDAEIMHWGPLKKHPLEEYELPLQHYVPGSDQHIICDRHLLGEHVYGPLYRGGSQLDPASQFHIEAFLNARGAVLVHLYEELEVLQRRHESEGEDFLERDHIAGTVLEYGRVVSGSRLQTKIVAKSTESDLVNRVLAVARGEEAAAQACSLVSGYVGPVYPSLLLLGEKPGLTAPEYTTTFAPMPGTSGRYLLETLLEHDEDLLSLAGMANAVDARAQLHNLWVALKMPPVVALGNAAYEVAWNAGLGAVGAVPHPQYWRRFQHGERAFYAKLIRQAWHHGFDLRKARP